MKKILVQLTALFFYLGSLPLSAQEVLKEALLIKLLPEYNILSPDPVAASIIMGEWKNPQPGDIISRNNEAVKWEFMHADSAGWFINDSLTNAYLFFQYKSMQDKIVLLEAMGNSMVYINGIPRSGNPYRMKDTYESWEPRFDYSLLPVKIIKGNNSLLFHCSRGVLKVKIIDKPAGVILNKEDLTIPDLIVNEPADMYGALPVINASENILQNIFVKTWSAESEPAYFQLPDIQPLSIYKTPFRIKLPGEKFAGSKKLNISLIQKNNSGEKELASAEIDLNIKELFSVRKETFISRMDGSVQYYAVNPSIGITDALPKLYLSLHGAGVEAINQANSYSQKTDAYTVAPTNRRPYGFNWENWGRLDALEVLEIAKEKFNIDHSKVYLTGHSMGGHGTWHLGTNYPDKFAAIGPSAGWISIWSYRIRPENDSSDIKKMLQRSAKQSDTYAFAENLKNKGIYIIHGSADDNVPPEQAYSMIKVLEKFHNDFVYHEEKGAGHWWDNSDEPGADCVDWKPMFDFFSQRYLDTNVTEIDFTTANLAVSSENYWIKIINQVRQNKISRIKIRADVNSRNIDGNTENIEMLSVDTYLFLGGKITVTMDGQTLKDLQIPLDGKITLHKKENKWITVQGINPVNKYPERSGNFREVLNNDVVFVFGTGGKTSENEWAFNKAKYDAERLWYQGNGSIEIIRDKDFNPGKYPDRNVILFGNSETNSAWDILINDAEINVTGSEVTFADKKFKGKDIACLFIRPRHDSKTASVAVVSGTGYTGMKLAGIPIYHHPYVNYPDAIIFNKDITRSDEEGILLTGYFGNDWSIEKGEFIAK